MIYRPFDFRFIPAIAGNTWWRDITPRRGTVHPRDRGEHFPYIGAVVRATGSSPRSRGTLPSGTRYIDFQRFIPAIAGNTSIFFALLYSISVHPRDRGEHFFRPDLGAPCFGSSPRSRGTRNRIISRVIYNRFIPAIAGNTRTRRPGGRSIPVHPRDRGEHWKHTAFRTSIIGSSPRSRGTLVYKIQLISG